MEEPKVNRRVGYSAMYFPPPDLTKLPMFLREGLSDLRAIIPIAPTLITTYETSGQDFQCFFNALDFIMEIDDTKQLLYDNIGKVPLSESHRQHLTNVLRRGSTEWGNSIVIEFASVVLDVTIPVYVTVGDILLGVAYYGSGAETRAIRLEASWSPNGLNGVHFEAIAYNEDDLLLLPSEITRSDEVKSDEEYDVASNDNFLEVFKSIDVKSPKKRIRVRKHRPRARDRWAKKNAQEIADALDLPVVDNDEAWKNASKKGKGHSIPLGIEYPEVKSAEVLKDVIEVPPSEQEVPSEDGKRVDLDKDDEIASDDDLDFDFVESVTDRLKQMSFEEEMGASSGSDSMNEAIRQARELVDDEEKFEISLARKIWNKIKEKIEKISMSLGSEIIVGTEPGLHEKLIEITKRLEQDKIDRMDLVFRMTESLKILRSQYESLDQNDDDDLTNEEYKRLREERKERHRERLRKILDDSTTVTREDCLEMDEELAAILDEEEDFCAVDNYMSLASRAAAHYSLSRAADFRNEEKFYAEEKPMSVSADVMISDSFHQCVDVAKDGKNVRWIFTEPDGFNYNESSIRSGEATENLVDAHKIRHNIVAGAIDSKETDRKLSDVFGPLDEDDNLTPDFIFEESHFIVVVEVGTSRATDEKVLEEDYNRKLSAYSHCLCRRARADKRIIYIPVIVGMRSVVSSIFLGQSMVNDLLIRMRIGCAIEDLAKEKGILTFEHIGNSQKEKVMSAIDATLSRCMKKDPPADDSEKKKIYITEDYIAKVVNLKPDWKKITNHYAQCIALSREDAMRKLPPMKESIEKYMKKVSGDGLSVDVVRPDGTIGTMHFRRDKKPVAIVPLIEPDPTETCKVPRRINIFHKEGPAELQEIWHHVLNECLDETWIDDNVNNLLLEAFGSTDKFIIQMETKRKEKRSKYHRVDISGIYGKVGPYLEKDGVNAKKLKNDPEHQIRQLFQKRAFAVDTEVDDIEEFINDSALFERSSKPLNCGEMKVMELLEKAQEIAGNTKFTRDCLEDWMLTKWYRAADLLTDIGAELTIGLKQNTAAEEMVLRKIPNYDVYILTKPTKSDSHIFFSLYCPNGEASLMGLPFRPVHGAYPGFMTDFVSVRADKLCNILNAGPRFLTVVSFFADFYGLDVRDQDACCQHSEFKKMVNFTMLVSIENKAATEECITASRYMYMELFKTQSSVIKPDPFKILSKFPTIFRSRLALYVMKKIIATFSLMVQNPPTPRFDTDSHEFDKSDGLPGDKWEGLLNCITGGPLESSTAAVNLMYIGYFKDKNEAAQENTEVNMAYKIVEAEMVIDVDNPALRGEMDGHPGRKKGSKNFCMHSIAAGCDLLKKRLVNSMGHDWESKINRLILKSLSKQLTHEIATLKASCIESHTDTDRTTTPEDKERIQRCKVIEALAADIGSFGTNPMLRLDDLLEYIENTSSGVICDLFKKSQHGGLREIYVLTIRSRLIQLALETFSRVLCSQFPEETLTHPENKLKTLDEHKSKAQKYSKSEGIPYTNICNSSDKTKWNQEFVMTAMSIPLFRLLPSKYHGFIQRAFNLWANKLIKLPPSVLRMMDLGIDLSSETFQAIKTAYYGGKISGPGIFRKKRSPFLNLTSGMMQGILHYTSSLLHLTFLGLNKMYMKQILKGIGQIVDKIQSKKVKKIRVLISSVCSSDDSATILTLFGESDVFVERDKFFLRWASILMNASVYFCRFFCMEESDKSAIAGFNTVEFNSEFILQNTLAVPYIKYVAAILNFTQSQSQIKACHEKYNLMSAAFQSGFPALNTHVCQIAQLIYHYKAIGSSTTKLFDNFFELIIDYPSPIHGFFLMDTDLAPGLAGFSYCYWKAISGLAPQLASSLKFLSRVEPEAGPDGVAVQSLSIRHGDLERWVKAVDRVADGKLVTSYSTYRDTNQKVFVNRPALNEKLQVIEENPNLFFLDPVNDEEVRIKLLMKMTSAGVADAMQRGNPLIQAFSATAYGLFTQCYVTTTLTKQVNESLIKETKKISLLKALTDTIEESERIEINDIDLDKHFPLAAKYKEMDVVIDYYRNAEEVQCRDFRQKKSTIRLASSASKLPISLLQCLRSAWYGEDCKYSNRVVAECLDVYKEQYPWLRGDFKTTLENSPFESFSELHGFLSKVEFKTRTFVRLGPRIMSASFTGCVHQLVKKCFMRRIVLVFNSPTYKKSPFRDGSFQDALCKLDLALGIPERDQRNAKATEVILGLVSCNPSTHQEKKAHIMSQFMNGILNQKSVVNEMKYNKLEPFLVFPLEQTRQESAKGVRWVGKGECVASFGGMEVRFTLKDGTITMLEVNDLEHVRKNPGLIINLMNRLQCRMVVRDCKNMPGVVATFDGKRFRSVFYSGTPVYVDPGLTSVFMYPEKIQVNIFYRGFGLFYYSKQGHKVYLLKYRTMDRELYSMSTVETRKGVKRRGIWDCWVDSYPLDCEELLSRCVRFFSDEIVQLGMQIGYSENQLLKLYKKVKWDKPWITDDEMSLEKRWLQDTFRKRIYFRGVVFRQVFESVCKEIEDEEQDDDIIDQDEDEIHEQIYNMLKSDYIGEALEDLIKGTREDMTWADQVDLEEAGIGEEDLMLASGLTSDIDLIQLNLNFECIQRAPQSVIESKTPDSYSQHPLWDRTIEILTEGSPSFITDALSGIVSPVFPQLSFLVQALGGVRTVRKSRNMKTEISFNVM
uniref:RNA-dependent RNA polymerase n=1 Tax=Hubei bunya-like virus 13 TaxID=1922846 RepID=A0A1L3KPH5_9VIRU|nr:RNA-dependent RNA polymerase [Hubei bunya-like virus 13]